MTTIRYEYDATQRLTAVIADDGARTEYSYDASGNLLRTVSTAPTQTQRTASMCTACGAPKTSKDAECPSCASARRAPSGTVVMEEDE